ncbi:MAG: hypothetical protein RBU37_20365, partial [Myxococcota bacterium]|nr:hypothetical protein [Myxococcota bacterium]
MARVLRPSRLGRTGQAPNRQELWETGQAPNRQEVGEQAKRPIDKNSRVPCWLVHGSSALKPLLLSCQDEL